MKKYILLIVAVVIFFAGCKKENKFTIEGTINGGSGKMMYIEELTPDGPHFLDSIQLDKKGNFTYKGKYVYQTFYNLHVSEYDYVVLLPYKGENIRIAAEYDSLSRSYHVEGSKESIVLWQLQDYSNYGAYKLQDIVNLNNQNRQMYANDEAGYKLAKQHTDSLYREAYDEQVMYITKFLEDNNGSLATLIALYKPFNGDHPLIDVDRYPELFSFYEQVLDGLESNVATADNPHTIAFKNVVERIRYKVERSRPQAINFTLNQPDGE